MKRLSLPASVGSEMDTSATEAMNPGDAMRRGGLTPYLPPPKHFKSGQSLFSPSYIKKEEKHL